MNVDFVYSLVLIYDNKQWVQYKVFSKQTLDNVATLTFSDLTILNLVIYPH